MASRFLILLFTTVQLLSSARADGRKCEPSDARWCSASADSVRGQDHQATYDFSKKGCDYGYMQSCENLYDDSKPLGDAIVSETKTYLIQKCAKNDAACEAVARIYYDEKEIAKALIIDRKYFLKYFKGAYPYEAYQAHQKPEGFAAARLGCEKDPDQCSFYIRYMPDHPQLNELLDHARTNCEHANGDSSGATTCAILGTYYYASQKHPKAIEIWNSECKFGIASDCALILGSDADTETKFKAYQHTCRPKDCESNIPELVLAKARKTLEGYLKEQHLP